jgi:hypothetical protein
LLNSSSPHLCCASTRALLASCGIRCSSSLICCTRQSMEFRSKSNLARLLL